KRFFAPAAQRHLEKLVFVTACELQVDEARDQTFDRRADSIGFFSEHTIIGQLVGEINSVNLPRALFVWAINFDFAVDPAGTQNGWVNQVGAIGSQDD